MFESLADYCIFDDIDVGKVEGFSIRMDCFIMLHLGREWCLLGMHAVSIGLSLFEGSRIGVEKFCLMNIWLFGVKLHWADARFVVLEGEGFLFCLGIGSGAVVPSSFSGGIYIPSRCLIPWYQFSSEIIAFVSSSFNK